MASPWRESALDETESATTVSFSRTDTTDLRAASPSGQLQKGNTKSMTSLASGRGHPTPAQSGAVDKAVKGQGLRVVSLNLGGRNTNPLEFEMQGDSSETAMEAVAILRKANKALQSVKEGPPTMTESERKLVDEILSDIYNDFESDTQVRIQKLLACDTWAQVLSHVKSHQPDLFNALNLSTLSMKRPSVWEDPASCEDFTTTNQFLLAWQEWYRALDRTSQFWLKDGPRTTKKRNMDMATGFAGLLVFDVMCLYAARNSMFPRFVDPSDDQEFGREVPFQQIAKFASKLPVSSIKARHDVAENFIRGVGAHVVFAQEAREFSQHTAVSTAFMRPILARDGFTGVFLRKDAFTEVSDISEAISLKMESLVSDEASIASQKAWRTSIHRLAAVHCTCLQEAAGCQVCLVSLHCSQSDSTAEFVETLRDVLASYDAELHIVGMDSNVSGKESGKLQKRLWSAGFEIGCKPKQEQVTVVKQRTVFQTQVKKTGATDISHKDYIVSWGSPRVRRGETGYNPDVRTAYGVDRETKRLVRLPTIAWPFDHCAVVASFQRKQACWRFAFSSRRQLRFPAAMAAFLFLVLMMPFASPHRESPYGPPGAWHHDHWAGTPRVGICEAAQPCGDGWTEYDGGCYMALQSMGYHDARHACEDVDGNLVSIDTWEENQVVTELCPESQFCWIGLNGSSWVSGEPVNFTKLTGHGGFMPLFPPTGFEQEEVAVLYSRPGEISGCHAEYLQNQISTRETFTGLVISLLVSAVLLVLPRPESRLTTAYLTTSFVVSLASWIFRASNQCFVADGTVLDLLLDVIHLTNTAGRMFAAVLAFWIIMKRLNMLCPPGAKNVVFLVLVGCEMSWLTTFVLFIDMTKKLSMVSLLVVEFMLLTAVIIVMHLIFAVVVTVDLYNIWAFLQREAITGLNKEGGTALGDGVRAAKIHLFIVIAAILTGAISWSGTLATLLAYTQQTPPAWASHALLVSMVVHQATNDLCAYLVAVLKIDRAIASAKGITTEVAERANVEVQQHKLAVRLLKAAPTSQEQLRHLAALETAARMALDTQDRQPFLILQSAVRVETMRIHRLMQCVRARAMTMPVRYQYLIDIPTMQGPWGAPRQHVPPSFSADKPGGDNNEYFKWLYEEADGAQDVLFHQVTQLLGKFNSTPWPNELGLSREQFPWTIWPSGAHRGSTRPIHKSGVVSPGDIYFHTPVKPVGGVLSKTAGEKRVGQNPAHCIVLEESSSSVRVHRSGMMDAEEVPREELSRCSGGGVFIPGPKKKEQRCRDKIAVDYEGREPWPAAASLLDICRCMILLDDPYAIAVLVAYIRNNMKVLRIKNRFSEDVLEPISPEELQSMFYDATDFQEVSGTSSVSTILTLGDTQYRDIAINVVIPSPSGVPFVCEIQVALSNLAILKHADTKLYTIRRMQSPSELRTTRVFSRVDEDNEDLGQQSSSISQGMSTKSINSQKGFLSRRAN